MALAHLSRKINHYSVNSYYLYHKNHIYICHALDYKLALYVDYQYKEYYLLNCVFLKN